MSTVTVLVVSRTAELLNRMLSSLEKSFSGDHRQLKILCSWNGSPEEESRIENKSRFEFLIAQRKPYHFATNMNNLADLATGDFLALANDDLILGKNAVDYSIQSLQQHDAGVVGIRLAKTTGKIGHAGIHFDQNYTPYHRLEGRVESNDPRVTISGTTAAVTGAFMAIRRNDFAALGGFNTSFKTCCEDVELCLRIRAETKKPVWFCADATAIHDGEATRQAFETRQNTSEDVATIRRLRKAWLANASVSDLRLEFDLAATEADDLRSISPQEESIEYAPEEEATDKQMEILRREALLRQKSRNIQNEVLSSIGLTPH